MSKKLSLLLVALPLIVPLTIDVWGGDGKGENKESSNVDLTQTFEAPSGVTVKYPEGWIAREMRDDQGITISNSQATEDAMYSSKGGIPEGALAIRVFPPMPFQALGLNADASAKDVLNAFFMPIFSFRQETVGDVKDTKAGGKDAARVSVASVKRSSEGFLVAYKIDDTNMMIVSVDAHTPDLGKYESTAQKIIDSISYTAPTANAVYGNTRLWGGSTDQSTK